MVTSDEVLAFWFGEPAQDEAQLIGKLRRWFGGGPELDAEVKARFGPAIEAAMRGALDDWAATPRGRLALVILLDQLTRNAYRGDARTYAGDEQAQRLALEAFDQGLDRTLDFTQRMFLAMPLLHSEVLAHHERLQALTPRLLAGAPPHYAKMVSSHEEQTAKYLDVVRRFGRFPHRNEILGRPSTDEERAFLAGWAERQAPKAARAVVEKG